MQPLARMVEPAGKLLEGVFAIQKPYGLSSAQVLRELQHAFADSRTFTPLLQRTRELEQQNTKRSKRKRRDEDNVFKMGHGGTLDPLATGVLIVGIGRGTKSLQNFLYCTKTYETVVLFGKSTVSYDMGGKVMASAESSHITQKLVEEKLASFRGKIKQVPPIYSALKIDGMKAYDYARTGKELPRELAAREMEVSECVITEWFEPGKHEFRWPALEVSKEEKDAFSKLVDSTHRTEEACASELKEESLETAFHNESNAMSETQDPFKPAGLIEAAQKDLTRDEKAAMHTHGSTQQSDQIADGPAVRVRLTVSSGFYVRSFAHDLGIACNSLGAMAALARTRQADFTTQATSTDLVPAIEYEDIGRGEEVWGPKVANILQDWLEQNSAPSSNNNHQPYSSKKGPYGKRPRDHDRRDSNPNKHRRRNSSSPE